uniref:TadE/TadG family type IV pilus assembly protein n=1 Tax=Ilumatobacter nonamiensis TaxID=467093 RepID=UPI0011D2AEF3
LVNSSRTERQKSSRVARFRARWGGERGATSLAVALLTPVFVVLLFAAVQATLWGHARTEARVAARDAAAQVARFDASAGDASASVQTRLADSTMTGVDVSISAGAEMIVVTVTATAPGIIIGTSRPISVTEAVPVERIIE